MTCFFFLVDEQQGRARQVRQDGRGGRPEPQEEAPGQAEEGKGPPEDRRARAAGPGGILGGAIRGRREIASFLCGACAAAVEQRVGGGSGGFLDSCCRAMRYLAPLVRSKDFLPSMVGGADKLSQEKDAFGVASRYT